jgi:hypothetical protein
MYAGVRGFMMYFIHSLIKSFMKGYSVLGTRFHAEFTQVRKTDPAAQP